MADPTNIDLVKGFDFTGVNPGTAADHNNLVDLARPYAETNPLEGKGFIITTQDEADNTPHVPDAISTNQNWKRYLWQRISGSGVTSTRVYKWDENVAPDATYLKWTELGSVDSINTAIAAIEADIVALQATQANQATQLNATAAIANAAAADAASALAAVPDVAAITQAVTVTLPAADSANAAAAANALAAANAAQSSATAAANNAASVAAAKFKTSSTAVFGAGSLIDEAHTLTGIPHFARFIGVCTVADNGYAIGDEVDLSQFVTGAGNTAAFSYGVNATNVFITGDSAAPPIRLGNKASGVANNVTLARWSVKAYLWMGY